MKTATKSKGHGKKEKSTEKPIPDGKQLVVRDERGRVTKGSVLNPVGRIVGSKNFATIADSVIEEFAKRNNLTFDEAEKVLVKMAFGKAKEGDFNFYRDFMDRKYGKPKERVEITGNGEIIHYHIPLRQSMDQWNGNLTNGSSSPSDARTRK